MIPALLVAVGAMRDDRLLLIKDSGVLHADYPEHIRSQIISKGHACYPFNNQREHHIVGIGIVEFAARRETEVFLLLQQA
ncbi:hypothetical protein D3C73_1280460 [compost metagenome]